MSLHPDPYRFLVRPDATSVAQDVPMPMGPPTARANPQAPAPVEVTEEMQAQFEGMQAAIARGGDPAEIARILAGLPDEVRLGIEELKKGADMIALDPMLDPNGEPQSVFADFKEAVADGRDIPALLDHLDGMPGDTGPLVRQLLADIPAEEQASMVDGWLTAGVTSKNVDTYLSTVPSATEDAVRAIQAESLPGGTAGSNVRMFAEGITSGFTDEVIGAVGGAEARQRSLQNVSVRRATAPIASAVAEGAGAVAQPSPFGKARTAGKLAVRVRDLAVSGRRADKALDSAKAVDAGTDVARGADIGADGIRAVDQAAPGATSAARRGEDVRNVVGDAMKSGALIGGSEGALYGAGTADDGGRLRSALGHGFGGAAGGAGLGAAAMPVGRGILRASENVASTPMWQNMVAQMDRVRAGTPGLQTRAQSAARREAREMGQGPQAAASLLARTDQVSGTQEMNDVVRIGLQRVSEELFAPIDAKHQVMASDAVRNFLNDLFDDKNFASMIRSVNKNLARTKPGTDPTAVPSFRDLQALRTKLMKSPNGSGYADELTEILATEVGDDFAKANEQWGRYMKIDDALTAGRADSMKPLVDIQKRRQGMEPFEQIVYDRERVSNLARQLEMKDEGVVSQLRALYDAGPEMRRSLRSMFPEGDLGTANFTDFMSDLADIKARNTKPRLAVNKLWAHTKNFAGAAVAGAAGGGLVSQIRAVAGS